MGRESSPFGLDEDFIEDPADPNKSIDKKMKKKMKLGNNPALNLVKSSKMVLSLNPRSNKQHKTYLRYGV